MFSPRMFTDRYSLWRPTLVKSSSGVQSMSDPETATATAQRCLFFDKAGRLEADESGTVLDYDATLLVPKSATLYPSKKGENPDKIQLTTQAGSTVDIDFRALRVVNERGRYKRAYLKAVPNA